MAKGCRASFPFDYCLTAMISSDCKDSVNLPQINFSMRANAIAEEPEIQKFWAEEEIYENLKAELCPQDEVLGLIYPILIKLLTTLNWRV